MVTRKKVDPLFLVGHSISSTVISLVIYVENRKKKQIGHQIIICDTESSKEGEDVEYVYYKIGIGECVPSKLELHIQRNTKKKKTFLKILVVRWRATGLDPHELRIVKYNCDLQI